MQLNRLERIITRCKSAAGFNMQEQNGLETQQPLDLHVCSRQVICLLTNLTKITVRVLSWSHSFPPSVDQYQGELQQAKLIVQVEVRRFTDPLKRAVSSVDSRAMLVMGLRAPRRRTLAHLLPVLWGGWCSAFSKSHWSETLEQQSLRSGLSYLDQHKK